MKYLLALSLLALLCTVSIGDDPDYKGELRAWRDVREKKLRADNGWLTLAGRFQLKPGVNTIGTGKDNDVVFPPEPVRSLPGVVTRIRPDRYAGVGPWSTERG